MMRRYFAGYVLLGDFLMREADHCSLNRAALQYIMRDTAAVFDPLISTVAEEYQREDRGLLSSPEERMAARVRALLSGELLDAADIEYDFDAWHLGAVAVGGCASEALKNLARPLDRRLLLVRSDDDTVWAWFGGRRPVESDTLKTVLSFTWSEELSLALGEGARGLAGWRLTHRQARIATSPGRRPPGRESPHGDQPPAHGRREDRPVPVLLERRVRSGPARARPGSQAAEAETSESTMDRRRSRRSSSRPTSRRSSHRSTAPSTKKTQP